MRLAFYHGPRKGIRDKLISIVVKWKSRGKFDHVELVIPSIAGNRWYSASLDDHGVRMVRKEEQPGYDPAHWTFVEIGGDAHAAQAWFDDHMGEPFDVWGVFSFFLGGEFTGRPTHWFCSEAVAAALGFEDPHTFDPCTLYRIFTKPNGGAKGREYE